MTTNYSDSFTLIIVQLILNFVQRLELLLFIISCFRKIFFTLDIILLLVSVSCTGYHTAQQ